MLVKRHLLIQKPSLRSTYITSSPKSVYYIVLCDSVLSLSFSRPPPIPFCISQYPLLCPHHQILVFLFARVLLTYFQKLVCGCPSTLPPILFLPKLFKNQIPVQATGQVCCCCEKCYLNFLCHFSTEISLIYPLVYLLLICY